MFDMFLVFGNRTRPQDLWPFLILETDLKFLIWTIHLGNWVNLVPRAHLRPDVRHDYLIKYAQFVK